MYTAVATLRGAALVIAGVAGLVFVAPPVAAEEQALQFKLVTQRVGAPNELPEIGGHKVTVGEYMGVATFADGRIAHKRFVDVSDPNHRPANVVGYRRNPRHGTDDELEFWVDPSGWVEITSGRDSKKAAKLSAKAGYLLGGEGRYQLLRRLPTGKRARVYVLTDLVLADDAEGQEDD